MNRLYEQIYKRKSVRIYNDKQLNKELKEKILSAISQLKLYNNKDSKLIFKIMTFNEFVESAKLKIIPKKVLINSPYYLAIYKNNCDDPYVNAGFCGEEIVLKLEEIGLKTCWVGTADPFGKSESFIIGIAFGFSDDNKEINRKRNDLDSFFEGECDNIEIVKALREAPSARNSQPVRLSFNENKISIFYRDGLRSLMKVMNTIDMGIALKHITLTLEKNGKDFSIQKTQNGFDIFFK